MVLVFFLAPKIGTGLSRAIFRKYRWIFRFLSTWSLALVFQTNGRENVGRFDKNGKGVILRKVLLYFFRKISTGMKRSIWILPGFSGLSIQMVSALHSFWKRFRIDTPQLKRPTFWHLLASYSYDKQKAKRKNSKQIACVAGARKQMGARKNGRATKTKNSAMILSLTGALVALCPFWKQKNFVHELTETLKLNLFCTIEIELKEKGRKGKKWLVIIQNRLDFVCIASFLKYVKFYKHP